MKGKVNQPSGIDTSDATAAAGDILATKTAYLAAGAKETGTLALTGDALVADVAVGKTFYKDDAKTKLTGTAPAASPVKSTQRGSTTLSGATSIDVTITAIDPTKSILIFTAGEAGGTTLPNVMVEGILVNATTIRFRKGTATGYTTIKWQVIEFNNVKSLQRGEITIAGSTATAAITAVDLNKSVLFHGGMLSTWATTTVADTQFSIRLVTNIRVDVETGNGNAAGTAAYQVVEFD